jgi:hypothetical protein
MWKMHEETACVNEALFFLFIHMDNFTNIWKAALLLEQKTSCNILVKLTKYKKQNYDKQYKSTKQGTQNKQNIT